MSAILIGYRGSGKTTIGKRLADRMWLKFVDTDEMIAKGAGRSIREIFERDGEAHFRKLETAAIKQACAMSDHVIAVGGGAVLAEENRRIMIDSGLKRIYLRCEPEVLLSRIQADPASLSMRPNLTDLAGGIDEVRLLLATREPLYREVMTAELDVTNLAPDEAVVYVTRLM